MRVTCSKCFFEHIKASFRKPAKPKYSIVRPANVSPLRIVPNIITKPPYADSGELPRITEPEIKTQSQINGMWSACKLARKVLNRVGKSIKVGITTDEIDRIVHELCLFHKAYPSPLKYKGFPKSVCTSVNNVACHGIPDNRPLQDGDIVNVDISVFFRGFHGDTSETFAVGTIDDDAKRLLKVGKECLHRGISVCRPGARFCDIGMAISEHADANGFAVVPNIIGHGIGTYFHGPPDIYHVEYVTEETEKEMQPGMTFTIEPIISEGSDEVQKLEDNWTIVSVDDSRSCQYEHTILITQTGSAILTKYFDDYEEI
ncbi:methionine aminopeptidase 1D, mitochondrial-like [Mya arenaria]|uniref:methionine aminopeptidase 1D, mitochondrial-like n=1 Tax=Mya arenaria TaxID=6604 RepID=UPI0022E2A863|nr:methionine aminopeptidase 1D, mitochondrial-like [Mya arenaria]